MRVWEKNPNMLVPYYLMLSYLYYEKNVSLIEDTVKRETPYIPSLESSWAPCTKSKNTSYTGGNMVGIGTLHKSNAIPIFSDDDAKDLSKMRR